MEQAPKQPDYILTLFEVCEILNKSSRTISRYVHKNILHPVGVKSRQGTLEYRFSRDEVEDLLARLTGCKKTGVRGATCATMRRCFSYSRRSTPLEITILM